LEKKSLHKKQLLSIHPVAIWDTFYINDIVFTEEGTRVGR